MARWLMPSNEETDKSDERILAREAEAMKEDRGVTVSREQLIATMMKNHGLTEEEANKRLNEGMESCDLKQDGDKIALPMIFKCQKPGLN